MPMRLQEIHPALVHFPIALLPAALAADALGRVSGNRTLLDVGKLTMPIAAASAAIAGVFGLIAQEGVRTDARTDPILTTHRNLNLSLIALTAAMAVARSRTRVPGAGYLAVGAAGIAAMSYSAYLGGHMVYEHGVGVSAAGGLLEDEMPEITLASAEEVARLSADHLASGVRHTVEYLGRGEVAPELRPGRSADRAAHHREHESTDH